MEFAVLQQFPYAFIDASRDLACIRLGPPRVGVHHRFNHLAMADQAIGVELYCVICCNILA